MHIRHMSEEAFEYINDMEKEKCSLALNGGFRYGYATTNMARVSNGVMKVARSLPVAAIVELTFYCVNKWLMKKREIARQRVASNHTHTPYILREK